MGRLFLYESDHVDDSVEVVALISRYVGRKQHEDDKAFGLDFLTVLDDGSGVAFIENKRCCDEYGIDEGIIKNLAEEFFYDLDKGIEVSRFYLDDRNYVTYENKVVSNFDKKNGKNSRRYIIVEFQGRFLMTDVTGLADATYWMKEDRDRNKTGLQWQNYLSLINKGAFY